jgi:uncharacterized protein YndB with AHSA1/START domain
MSRDGSDGVIRKLPDGYEIVFVRRLAKPIEKVWVALTQPERIADWLGVATPEQGGVLSVGVRFELRFPQSGYWTMCEVVAMDAPRLFAWTWGLREGPRGWKTPCVSSSPRMARGAFSRSPMAAWRDETS